MQMPVNITDSCFEMLLVRRNQTAQFMILLIECDTNIQVVKKQLHIFIS